MNATPGERTAVALRPATLDDRRTLYDWMACSDVTPAMMGPPDYPDHPIPTWEQFCGDYVEHFFDGSAAELGRCFVIVADGEEVGTVSYSRIDRSDSMTELDIWMRSLADCGKGIGSRGLSLLCDRLVADHDVRHFLMRPSARNHRAIAAYGKCGFLPAPERRPEIEARFGPPDLDDAVILIRSFP